MISEGKIWFVFDAINDARNITPSGDFVVIDTRDINKNLEKSDYEKIIQKLANDEQLFEIIKKPNYNKNYSYIINISNITKFDKSLRLAHIKYFGSLELMDGENFFAIVDVTLDIHGQLNITSRDDVEIPNIQQIIKFPILCPGNDIGSRDRYCDLRSKAINYLKDNEYITDYKYNVNMNSVHRWNDGHIISVDRIIFTKFYMKLFDIYGKKIKKTDVETSEILSETNNLDSNNTESDVNLGNNSLVKSVFENQGKIYLSLTDKGKDDIYIGKANSIPHLLFKHFDKLGEYKPIDFIFRNTTKRSNLLDDPKLTYQNKLDKIKVSLNGLNKILKKHTYCVYVKDRKNEKSVSMILKRI